MKAFMCVVAASLTLSRGASGQITLTRERAPYLTADQITAEAASESTAATLVAQALAEWMRLHPNTTTPLIASQIPEQWLPTIPGVQFVRLSDDAARVHLQECGKLLFVHSLKLTAIEQATVGLADGTPCSVQGMFLRFQRLRDGWHFVTEGVDGGFVSVTGHCQCGGRSG
jgi:hypothetical protein